MHGDRPCSRQRTSGTSKLEHPVRLLCVDGPVERDLERAVFKAFGTRPVGLLHRPETGLVSLDPEGLIRQANFGAAQQLGIARADLINRRFSLWVVEHDRDTFNAFLRRAFSSNAKEYCEVMLPGIGGTPLHARVEGIVAEKGLECRTVILDITERARAEQALHDLSRRLMETEEQDRRFRDRADTPRKRWKLSEEDFRNRKRRAEYDEAVKIMLRKTSIARAPWHVIPADD